MRMFSQRCSEIPAAVTAASSTRYDSLSPVTRRSKRAPKSYSTTFRRQAADEDSSPVKAQHASSHKSHDRLVLLSKRTQFAKVKAKQGEQCVSIWNPATLQRQRDDRRSQQVCRITSSKGCRQRGCESPVWGLVLGVGGLGRAEEPRGQQLISALEERTSPHDCNS